MKLELKHLAPYLPYKLLIEMYGFGTKFKAELVVYNYSNNLLNGVSINQAISNGKPILRNLSYLTKEIEVNGKKFVPALVLWSVSIDEEERFLVYGEIPDYWNACLKLDFANDFDFRTMKKLFEWHFDVFNLRSNNLCIYYDELNK
jgi:hypothetical protein